MSGFFYKNNIKCTHYENETEVENDFLSIKESVLRLIEDNKKLREENVQLKSEHYKNNEIIKLQTELKAAETRAGIMDFVIRIISS